jgi:DNA (cytosine-5)-methyltransferase 1
VDANACATLKLNFPGVGIWDRDIGELCENDALSLAGIAPGDLDVLDGSPPCQGFSTAGKRVIEDDRNSLFLQFVRILRAFRPRVMIMENVPGLTHGAMKRIYFEIMNQLDASGYNVKGAIMNAVFFGVPQKRRRVIIVGVRKDLDTQPSHPKPSPTIVGCRRLDERQATYSANRFGDRIEKEGWPVSTITKIGRKFWNTKSEFGHRSYAHAASFPEDFVWTGSHSEIRGRIGNSVPPLLMKSIAEHIRRNIIKT